MGGRVGGRGHRLALAAGWVSARGQPSGPGGPPARPIHARARNPTRPLLGRRLGLVPFHARARKALSRCSGGDLGLQRRAISSSARMGYAVFSPLSPSAVWGGPCGTRRRGCLEGDAAHGGPGRWVPVVGAADLRLGQDLPVPGLRPGDRPGDCSCGRVGERPPARSGLGAGREAPLAHRVLEGPRQAGPHEALTRPPAPPPAHCPAVPTSDVSRARVCAPDAGRAWRGAARRRVRREHTPERGGPSDHGPRVKGRHLGKAWIRVAGRRG